MGKLGIYALYGVVLYADTNWLHRLVLVLVPLLLLWVSLRTHPYRPCRICGGDPVHRHPVLNAFHDQCRGCDGKGRVLRFGASGKRIRGS